MEAIVLWKSATETSAWKTLTQLSCRVCFPSSRIQFVGPSGNGGPGPTFSPALFYVGDRPGRSAGSITRTGPRKGKRNEIEIPIPAITCQFNPKKKGTTGN